MKRIYVLFSATLLVSFSSYAQKNELKAAEKALKSQNYTETMSSLSQAKSLMGQADDSQKAQYYFLKGSAHLELAKKDVDTDKNLLESSKSFQELIDFEKDMKKKKYTEQAAASIKEIKALLLNQAVALGNDKGEYGPAAEKLYEAYLLDKNDTINLYYAASYAVNAKNYDTALSYYEQLKKINFSGKKTDYYAVSIADDQEYQFPSKAERDNAVKSKVYVNPRDEKVPSKKGEIYGNYALILIQKGEIDKAKVAIGEAKRLNPDDITLIVTEANIYYELGEYDAYRKLIEVAIEKRPNDPELFFNLGVASSKLNKSEDAAKHYKKAIELDPSYSNAYLNLAAIQLENEQAIIAEMNSLGNSPKDNKRYNELKKEREALLAKALPYLEKAVEHGGGNEVKRTLMNIYYTLDMDDKYQKIKKSLD